MSPSKRPNLNFAGILSREAEQSRGSDTSAVGLFGDHPARHLATCRPAQSRLARVAKSRGRPAPHRQSKLSSAQLAGQTARTAP